MANDADNDRHDFVGHESWVLPVKLVKPPTPNVAPPKSQTPKKPAK